MKPFALLLLAIVVAVCILGEMRLASSTTDVIVKILGGVTLTVIALGCAALAAHRGFVDDRARSRWLSTRDR